MSKKKRSNSGQQSRLLEYYFVVGASPKSVDAICNRLSQQKTLAPRQGSKPYFANFAYKPKVIDRYPLNDYPESPLLPWVARACLPRGVRVRTKPPPPKFGWFVGYAPDGALLYGSYLVVYERLPLTNQAEPVYQPKALGLVSHFPMFYAFEVFLTCLWHSVPKNIITLEELLVHYFLDIPAPMSGRKISYDLGRMKVGLVRPTPLDLPVVELPRAVLFQRLSVDRIALLIKCILLQKRIILVSSTECELMAVGETLRSLIFPLKWNHLYIPLMTRNVGSQLHCHQGPFLVGVPRFMLRRPEFQKFPKHSIVVFLDKNEIRLMNTQKPVSDLTPLWPQEYKRRLQNVMEEAACVFTDTEQNTSKERVYDTLKEIFSFMCEILKLTRSAKPNPFTRRFSDTSIYKDFMKRYLKDWPNDKKLSKVYLHYMDNQKIALGFSLPARGTLAKIARSTEHYSTPFPTVNANAVRKKENKHRQKGSNKRPKMRPTPDKCNSPALEFLQQTLLAPSKSKANSALSPDSTRPQRELKVNASRRISFLGTRETRAKTDGDKASSTKPVASPPIQTAPVNAPEAGKGSAEEESTEQHQNQHVLKKLESIIQQAKNSNDIDVFQDCMAKIQNLLRQSEQKNSAHAVPSLDEEDIFGSMQIDEHMLQKFQHLRSASMSTVQSSNSNADSESEEEESWGSMSEEELDRLGGEEEKSRTGSTSGASSTGAQDTFRCLNEFDIDESTRKCFFDSQRRHQENVGEKRIQIQYDDHTLISFISRLSEVS